MTYLPPSMPAHIGALVIETYAHERYGLDWDRAARVSELLCRSSHPIPTRERIDAVCAEALLWDGPTCSDYCVQCARPINWEAGAWQTPQGADEPLRVRATCYPHGDPIGPHRPFPRGGF